MDGFYQVVSNNKRISRYLENISLYDLSDELIGAQGAVFFPMWGSVQDNQKVVYSDGLTNSQDGTLYFEVGMPVYQEIGRKGYNRIGTAWLLFNAGYLQSIVEGALPNEAADLCMYEMTNGKVRLMYLIANQSRTDGKMRLRKAGYIGGIYRSQYEGRTLETFPVIEIVLYWGKPKWKDSRTLQRLFRKKEILEDEWKYIDDMRVHIFEMRHLSEKTRELFQSDMRIIADFLAEGKNYYSDRKIVHKAALIKMVKVLFGDMDVGEVEKWMEEQGIREEDEVKVCELFDQYERRGRREGEGRFARLVQILIDGGRDDDLRRAAVDSDYREQLYVEANLV